MTVEAQYWFCLGFGTCLALAVAVWLAGAAWRSAVERAAEQKLMDLRGEEFEAGKVLTSNMPLHSHFDPPYPFSM